MTSIRTRLLLWLMPAFILIITAAGFALYFSTAAELDAQLDNRLTELAGEIRLSPLKAVAPLQKPAGPPRKSGLPARRSRTDSASLLEQLPDDIYCEIWIQARGVHEKTPNLGPRKLPRPESFQEQPSFSNAHSDSGRHLRIRAERRPLIAKLDADLLIAINRAEADAALSGLAAKLITAGATCCLTLSILLTTALHAALRPLRNIGEQAAKMDAGSLHQRFPETKVPADIRPIVGRLNSLMATLEASFDRERRFSSDLAHELRNPLAAIRTTSEVALKWPEQSTPEDHAEIVKLTSGLQQTLDSLLLLARMESSAAEFHQETIATASIIHDGLRLFQHQAEQKQLEWKLELNETIEISADRKLLQILLSNLISNAVEYAPPKTAIHLTNNAQNSIFQCANQAPNLRPEDLQHLFERLWRKDAVRTDSEHTGLGLSIAQSCAGALGRSLTAELTPTQQLIITLS